MPAYFDPVANVDMVPERLRSNPRLASLAAGAEADILGVYTRVGPGGLHAGVVVDADHDLRVMLRGFHPDPALASPALAAALRGAIARTLAWRLEQDKAQVGLVRHEGSKDKTKTLVDGADAAFPRGAFRTLRVFDLREAPWAI